MRGKRENVKKGDTIMAEEKAVVEVKAEAKKPVAKKPEAKKAEKKLNDAKAAVTRAEGILSQKNSALETAKSDLDAARKALTSAMVTMLGIRPKMHLLPPKSVVRSEGKAVRVIDKRKLHD